MQTNIENFYRSVAQNPALLNKITTDVSTPDEFIDRAVAVAKDEGYAIDRTEAKSWIDAQITAKSNGELSDVQLEGVAGGKGNATAAVNTAFNDANRQFEKSGREFQLWVQSW